MEITAILPMMPPAMAPAFELCPPGLGLDPTGVDVPVLDDVVVEAGAETDELDAPSNVPGPCSGESMKVRRGHKTVTGNKGERNLTTSGTRFGGVPVILILERDMSILSKKKA